MCGICGIIDYKTKDAVTSEAIQLMCQAMKHRGPDDEGIYIKNSNLSVGLGHRRLSIIDLSAAGHQPMPNEDGTVWTVLNGEIYNYKELKDELIAKGHFFKSNTDTEAIIHLYEQYGSDCVKYLRGMFAFAVWDEKSKSLLLARDRPGKKPLLYYYDGRSFCFASEFSSILASGLIEKEINIEAVNYYFTFGYIPAPLTIYNNVFKLPPAHLLILKDGKTTVKRYWQLDYANKIDISEDEAALEVMRLLKEAVKIRLNSDVPLGSFLSGGIDSSTVVALMSQLSDKRVKTFSIGFEEQDYNELKYARNIAKLFNTEHHEFIVKPNALEILPTLIERYGEPYADSSCVPTYYVCRETKRYVTVALNGDGGDELFAGYERYQAMHIAEACQRMPVIFKDIIKKTAAIFPDSINAKDKLRRLRRFFEAAMLPAGQRYVRWVSIFDDAFKKNLYSEEFLRMTDSFNHLRFIEQYLDDPGTPKLIDRLLMTDTNTYLPDDLLVKVDIASMANSLEARSPFLDHKLMEFAASLPAEYKMKRLIKKYILKKSINGLIPPENVYRQKMGFGLPVGEWFRGDLKEFLCEKILSKAFFNRGYFKVEPVKDMVRQHIAGKKDYTFQLWALLAFELWHLKFIDNHA